MGRVYSNPYLTRTLGLHICEFLPRPMEEGLLPLDIFLPACASKRESSSSRLHPQCVCVCVVFLPLPTHTELNAALEINQERGGYLWMEWNGERGRGFKGGLSSGRS